MKTTIVVAGLLVMAAAWIGWRFLQDISDAQARASAGGTVIDTRCGPIEYQQAGNGQPLLIVHGSGGGHDQGMDYARPLAGYGQRVIAMSRFGYLRTPRPVDPSPAAQADAHICLLDALGISRAAIMGVSAGAPSAIQAAIRHPDRIRALVLVVPIAHKPGHVADSAPPKSDAADALLLRLLGSDFVFWAALRLAPDQVVRHVLATPPALVAAATTQEQARVRAMAQHVLPVSLRAAGLRDDTRLGKSLGDYPLESIRTPTLVVSARDDGFGTFATAQYMASRIPGARFIGYAHGGHLLVGHDDALRTAIVQLLEALP